MWHVGIYQTDCYMGLLRVTFDIIICLGQRKFTWPGSLIDRNKKIVFYGWESIDVETVNCWQWKHNIWRRLYHNRTARMACFCPNKALYHYINLNWTSVTGILITSRTMCPVPPGCTALCTHCIMYLLAELPGDLAVPSHFWHKGRGSQHA